MDTIRRAALDSLTNTLAGLLPPVADPALKPLLSVNPVHFTPTGLGSFVGVQVEEPQGEIHGCRVRAIVLITVKASSLDTLDQAVTDTTRALIGADNLTLRQRGILNIALDDIGPRSASPQRDLKLTVLYEFLTKPAASEGIIQTVPLNLTVSS